MEEFQLIISNLFAFGWAFFEIPVLGFDFTFGQFYIAYFLLGLMAKIVAYSLGGPLFSDIGCKNNRNIKVSDDRKDDTL